MNYPLNKFVLEHSEEYPDGKTLVMKIGNNTDDFQPIDVIAHEVQPNEDFYIIISKENMQPYPGKLTKDEKRQSFINLFSYGIKDER